MLKREIFGPILPLVAYDTLDEVIARINSGPRPLALYPFSNDNARIERLLTHVMSGGVSINDALFHVGQHDLPFGGIGDSGMGHYHGREKGSRPSPSCGRSFIRRGCRALACLRRLMVGWPRGCWRF